jgi:hypothetical protein
MINVLNPFQSIHFNQYYTQSSYTMDDFIASNTGNVNFIQYDKILDSDSTTIDSTISFGTGSSYYMAITQGTNLNKSFWKRRRTPGTDIFIKTIVTHSANNTIGFFILGTLVTLTTSGVLTIAGGPTLTLTGHTSTERVTFYIKIFNSIFNLTIVQNQNNIYSLTYKVPTVPNFAVVGFGTGIYTTFQTRLMKNALGCFIIGSSLLSSSNILSSLANKQQLFDKNIIIQNFSYIAASISSGIQNEIDSTVAIKIDNGSNVVILSLQVEQINNSASNPVDTFITDITNIINNFINKGMSVWVINMMAFQNSDIVISQQVNEVVANLSNIKLIDLASLLIDNSSGMIASQYFTTGVSGPILNSNSIEILSKYLLLWLYDELDSEQYISRLGADNIIGNGTSISNNIYQGLVANSGTFSGTFSNHLYLNSNYTNSILFNTNNNNNTGVPIVSGTRPNSTRMIYNQSSTFDTSRGVNNNDLWDSVDGVYQQYTSGFLSITNNIDHFNILHDTVIGNTVNPSGNVATLNILGDSCINGVMYNTQITSGVPTLSTRNLGTRQVFKSNISSSTCDTALGVDSTNGLWISNADTFRVFQHANLALSTNILQTNVQNSFVVSNTNTTKTELVLTFPTGSSFLSDYKQAFRLRIDTTSSCVFEQSTGLSTGLPIFNATMLYGLGDQLILDQKTYFNTLKSNSTFTVSSNSVNTDISQCGVVILPTSNFSNSMVLPQTATFTLNNKFIKTTSVVLLTLSTVGILSSTFAVVRSHNIANGSIVIDVVILAGVSPPANNILIHYLIN